MPKITPNSGCRETMSCKVVDMRVENGTSIPNASKWPKLSAFAPAPITLSTINALIKPKTAPDWVKTAA